MQLLKAREESSLLHLRQVGSGNGTLLEWILVERAFVIYLGVFKMVGAGCRSKGPLHLLLFAETSSEALNFENAAILDQLVLHKLMLAILSEQIQGSPGPPNDPWRSYLVIRTIDLNASRLRRRWPARVVWSLVSCVLPDAISFRISFRAQFEDGI